MTEKKRLIDANKVINAMQKTLDENQDLKGSVAYFAFESIISMLKQEPTVDAAPVVHGYWIYHADDLFPAESTQECSVCHEHEYVTIYNENFCPNCGERMGGYSFNGR